MFGLSLKKETVSRLYVNERKINSVLALYDLSRYKAPFLYRTRFAALV